MLPVGNSIICTAQSGCGKSLAFLLPMLHVLITTAKIPDGETQYRNPHLNSPRAVVIVPSRELVQQLYDLTVRLCSFTPLIVKVLGRVLRDEDHGDGLHYDILISTPGIYHKLIRKGEIKTNLVQYVVIDEADTLLDASFRGILVSIFRIMELHGHNLPPKFEDGLKLEAPPPIVHRFLGRLEPEMHLLEEGESAVEDIEVDDDLDERRRLHKLEGPNDANKDAFSDDAKFALEGEEGELIRSGDYSLGDTGPENQLSAMVREGLGALGVQLVLVGTFIPENFETIVSEFVPLETMVRIRTQSSHRLMAHVPQRFVRLHGTMQRPEHLLKWLKLNPTNTPNVTVIFCNRANTCVWLKEFLSENGIRRAL